MSAAAPARSRGEAGAERRDASRRPARLFACRLVDGRGRFLCDAAVRDLSAAGARIGVPAGVALPTELLAFDETRERFSPARVAWRAGTAAGLSLGPWRALAAAPADVARRLRAAYYAAD